MLNVVLNMHGIKRLGPSGVGTYGRGLLRGLSAVDRTNRYLVVTGGDEGFALPPNFSIHVAETKSKTGALYFNYFRVNKLVADFSANVYHSLKSTLPSRKRCASVITIFDLIFMRYPQFYPIQWKLYWNKVVKSAARQADAVVTVSNNSADDIAELLSVPRAKIVVAYPGAPDGECADMRPPEIPGGLEPKSFFLYVGNVTIRKNVHGLIEAFDICKKKYKLPHKLVVVGNMDWKWREALANIERLGLQSSVHYAGYLPAGELAWLYANATALVYPSFYEGFGLPVLEAMSAGCPVVSSKTSSIPEVAGDAALLVDPAKTEEIAEAMFRIADSDALAKSLAEKGRVRAERFSWESTARTTLDVYRRVAT